MAAASCSDGGRHRLNPIFPGRERWRSSASPGMAEVLSLESRGRAAKPPFRAGDLYLQRQGSRDIELPGGCVTPLAPTTCSISESAVSRLRAVTGSLQEVNPAVCAFPSPAPSLHERPRQT